MRKEQAIALLSQSKPILKERYGVARLALFGSTARDMATENSDIDILIAFDGLTDSQRYFGVLFYLEDLLDCAVDLITEKALRPELKLYIDREKIDV